MAEEDEIRVRPGRKIEQGDDTSQASPAYRTLHGGEGEVGGREGLARRQLVICPNCGAAVYIEWPLAKDYPIYRCAYCGEYIKLD